MLSSTKSIFCLPLVVLILLLAVVLLVSSAATSISAQSPPARSICPIKAYGIMFQPIDVEPRSFLYAEGQTATVTRSRKFPRIIVRAIDSNGDFDTTVNFVNIVVSSNDPTTTIDGSTATAPMYKGEAHFDSLTILNGDMMRLNFTAVSEEQIKTYPNKTIGRYFFPLHMKFITTGLINVERQPIEQFALQFLTHSSFIRYPNTPFTTVSGITIPTIRLQVVRSDYTQYTPLLGLANNFTIGVGWASTPPPGTTLTGVLQPIVAGYATFDSLVITTTSTAPLPGLVFSLHEPYLTVSTGPISIDILRDSARIDFMSAETSFIYTVGQQFSGQDGTPFPKIQISVRDNMGRAATPASGLIITASCSRGQLTNKVAGVVDGVATFDSLFFYGLAHEELRPYVLTFTAGTLSTFHPLRTSDSVLYTGIVMMGVTVIPAYRFRFMPGVADAFFNGMFIRKQVVKDEILSPPLRLELLDSSNQRDTTTTSVSVTIAVENGRFSSSQVSLPFTSGVASFPDFEFTTLSTIDNSYVVLTVTNNNNALDRLVTGRVNVTNAVSNFNLRFQPYGASLFSAQNQPSFATINKAMPPIVVELITSANALDTGSNDITITATASGGATLTGSFVRVANGVATFRDLTFVSDIPGDFKLTFTAGDAGSAPVGGKSIVTGAVTTFPVITANVRPRFIANSSYIQYAGQSRPITLEIPIPDIYVELASSDHTGPKVVNGTAANILGEISLSNGAFQAGTKVSGIPVTNGKLTLTNLRIKEGLDPILSICFRSGVTSGSPPPADGHCISTGPLRTTAQAKEIDYIGYLEVYKPVTTIPTDGKVAKGQLLTVAVDLRTSTGTRTMGAASIEFDVEATTSVQLAGTTRVAYNKTSGYALFNDLVFREDLSAGITPAITFAAVRKLSEQSTPAALLKMIPISTQLLSIQGANANSGVDVVAEILTDYLTFDPLGWRAKVAKRLNVEPERIQRLRVFRGKSADPDASGANSITEDTTERLPSWSGTRFDMRFLPPLATSRDTRTAQDLADLFVNLKPSCLIGELKLRKAYFNATDTSCDWYLFDAQLTSVRSCLQSKGQEGYCACHVPLFAFMGNRCLGLPRMTSLCLNILINKDAANCQQTAITDVCKKLLFPDAPRTAIAASGAAMFLCFIPLLYLYNGGFFHKINLPTSTQSRISKAIFVASDEKDLL